MQMGQRDWWPTGQDKLNSAWSTPGDIRLTVDPLLQAQFLATAGADGDLEAVRLHVEQARLRLLRGFEELLCLQGLQGVEHMPHQIETVRKVLRHFRGRVLLADEVGLGKTIEACLLLREYILRGMVQKVLILVPAAIVHQWSDELSGKFLLDFSVAGPSSPADFWNTHPHVLASLALAKSRKHTDAVTAQAWDLVIVDEAHHCKSRNTRNWQLVNSLKRRHLFLLSATPVQNNLVELYNLLTLLEPGHLKTEADFKRTYVKRGNPRDPQNRERLRGLLSEVMVRNTRSLVNINLPPRYAQTFVVKPEPAEQSLYRDIDTYLRWRCQGMRATTALTEETSLDEQDLSAQNAIDIEEPDVLAHLDAQGIHPASNVGDFGTHDAASPDQRPLLPTPSRMQINSILMAAGSHPAALVPALTRLAEGDDRAAHLVASAAQIHQSAKERKLLELLAENRKDKSLVFINFRASIQHLHRVLAASGIEHVVFSGEQSTEEKTAAVEAFRATVPVMLCSDSGGEGHNLQFANTLINFDLPWNPMRIEQRIGRLHRIGQTREVFVFNLCTAGSLEERILRVLNDKIHMFELVVGEVGSILGNMEEGQGFESLVMQLWLKSHSSGDLDAAFAQLGESLVTAQEQYLQAKELDDALFGEDFE